MSFSKNGTYVYPYSIPMAPGDYEPIAWDAQQPIAGAPTAELIDHATGALATVQPGVTIASGTIYIIGVTAPPTPDDAIYVVSVTWTGSSGRVWTDRLALLVSSK